MAKPTASATRPVLVAIALLLFLLLPTAYILGIGPAVWLLEHGYVTESVVLFIYSPLDKLAREHEPLGDAFRWYISLFVDR